MASGNVQLTTNGTQTLATFSCDVGFTLSGGYTSECSSDGTWTTTGSYPSCCMVICFIYEFFFAFCTQYVLVISVSLCSLGEKTLFKLIFHKRRLLMFKIFYNSCYG